MSIKQEQLIEFENRLIRTGQWSTCLNCEFWEETSNCGKWKQTPPLDVIVVGCPEWIDKIPF